MRRTFISLLLAIGEDVPYVMAQVGHVDPKVTLSIYAQVMFRGEGERERLEGLVNGSDWALRAPVPNQSLRVRRRAARGRPKTPPIAGLSTMGAAGFEPATSRV